MQAVNSASELAPKFTTFELRWVTTRARPSAANTAPLARPNSRNVTCWLTPPPFRRSARCERPQVEIVTFEFSTVTLYLQEYDGSHRVQSTGQAERAQRASP